MLRISKQVNFKNCVWRLSSLSDTLVKRFATLHLRQNNKNAHRKTILQTLSTLFINNFVKQQRKLLHSV